MSLLASAVRCKALRMYARQQVTPAKLFFVLSVDLDSVPIELEHVNPLDFTAPSIS